MHEEMSFEYVIWLKFDGCHQKRVVSLLLLAMLLDLN